jgi:hypothetical protein
MMGMRRFAWTLLLLSGCPIGDLTSESDASTQPDASDASDAAPNDGTTTDVQDAAVTDSPSDAPNDVAPKNFTLLGVTTAFGTANLNISKVADGHTIIVCVVSYYVTGVTDDKSNTYTKRIGGINAGSNGVMYVYTALSSSGGPTLIQVTTANVPDGGTPVNGLYVAEYSGLTAYDVAKNGSSTSNAVDGLTTPVANVSALPSLLVGWALANQNIKDAGTGFTWQNGDNGDLFEDRVVWEAGSYAATATQNDDGGGEGDIILVTFH